MDQEEHHILPAEEALPAYSADPPADKHKAIKQKASDDQIRPTDQTPSDETTARKPTALDALFDSTTKRMICAFGPRTSFFFYGGDPSISWTYQHIDRQVPRTISGASVGKWNISTPYCVALSPSGAGYFAYKSPTTGISWCFMDVPMALRPRKMRRKSYRAFEDMRDAHRRLKDWLKQNLVTAKDIETTKVVLGPGGRFMAWKKDGIQWIGNALPTGLSEELKSKEGKAFPTVVTFGVGNAWAAIWNDGSSPSIDLDGNYTQVNEFLSQPLLKDNLVVRESGNLWPKTLSYSLLIHWMQFISLSSSDKSSYYVRSKPANFRLLYNGSDQRRTLMGGNWRSQMLAWSKKLDQNLSLTYTGLDGEDRRDIITPETEAQAARVQSVNKAGESERIHTQTAKAAQDKKDAEKLLVVGGALALAAVCTVM